MIVSAEMRGGQPRLPLFHFQNKQKPSRCQEHPFLGGAQQRRRLHNQQCLPPGFGQLRPEQQIRTIGWFQPRPFDLTLQQRELMAQERVLGNQIHFAAGQVKYCGD